MQIIDVLDLQKARVSATSHVHFYVAIGEPRINRMDHFIFLGFWRVLSQKYFFSYAHRLFNRILLRVYPSLRATVCTVRVVQRGCCIRGKKNLRNLLATRQTDYIITADGNENVQEEIRCRREKQNTFLNKFVASETVSVRRDPGGRQKVFKLLSTTTIERLCDVLYLCARLRIIRYVQRK